MIPLICFSSPCLPCDSKRRDDQDFVNLEAVEEKVVQCRQRDARFAQAHIQEDGGNGMLLYEIDGVTLIVMGSVLHRVSLRSVLCCR